MKAGAEIRRARRRNFVCVGGEVACVQGESETIMSFERPHDLRIEGDWIILVWGTVSTVEHKISSYRMVQNDTCAKSVVPEAL